MPLPEMNPIHFEISSQDLALIGPLLILALTACVVLVIDFFRIGRDKSFAFYLTALGIVVAAVYDILMLGKDLRPVFGGLVTVDRLSILFNALLFLSALLAVFLSRTYLRRENRGLAEYYLMVLMVLMGMSIMASSGDLMVLFLGVELLSIPLYVLAAFLRNRRASVEAGLKYFLLGAFASAFLLFGIALLYGATGSTLLPRVIAVLSQGAPTPLALCGLGLIAVGLAFKVAAVPFHMWAPDVYEGAPTPITAFMATGVKVAGFVAIIRVFAFLETPAHDTLAAGAAALAVLTMLVGNLGALPQKNIKRMLAFSSVAHAGYLLVGVAAGLKSQSPEAFQAIMYYLLAYTFMNVGAFGTIIFLSSRGRECNEIDDLKGLSLNHPGVALPMAIFMFTLAGIPPSAGFFGKFYLFKAAVDAGMVWLAVTAVLMSVISLYYYLRIITTMYLKKPATESPVAEPCPYLATVALVSVAGVLLIGVFPEDLLKLLGTVF
jgi:NADH-quinone oxidoreductase subunit N